MFAGILLLSVGVILGITSCATAPPAEHPISLASCEFTVDLLKNLGKSDKNVLLSPVSISILLAILQQGAKENTALQLQDVLHLTAHDSKTGHSRAINFLQNRKDSATIEWGNKVYIQPEFRLEKDFQEAILKDFQAAVERLDFSQPNAASKINAWVEQATKNHVKNLISPDFLTPDTVMVLVNAIFFKALWKHPFKVTDTINDIFTVKEGETVEVPFMALNRTLTGVEDRALGVKYVKLPFQGWQFSMIFLLPLEDHKLNEVIDKFRGDDLKKIIRDYNPTKVSLTIPKFKLSEKISLVDTLKELGLTDLFTTASHLEGISSSDKQLQVSAIVHEANVEIDETGSTAAAATIGEVHTLSLHHVDDEMSFIAKQPFLFLIVDETNQIPLFAGKVNNPKTGS